MAKEIGRQPITDFSKGLLQTSNPLLMPSGAATDLNNVDCKDAPILALRDGVSNFYNSFGVDVNFLGQFRSTTGLYQLLGGKLSDGVIGKWNGTDFSDTVGTMTPSLPVYGTIFPAGDILVLTDGVLKKKWDGTTFADLGGTPPAMTYLETHLSKVWGVHDLIELHYSATGNAEDWTTTEDAGYIGFDTSAGSPIIAIKSYRGKLYVWTQSAMYAVLGTSPANFSVVQVHPTAGCWSHLSVVECRGFLYWFGPDGIWEYYANTIPRLISDGQIDEILDDTNGNYVYNTAAGTDGNQYFVSIRGLTHDRQIRFDPRYRSWWIDEDVCYTRYLQLRRP